MAEKEYGFQIPTPMGVQMVKVAHSDMCACPECGSELFKTYYRIGYLKPRTLPPTEPIRLCVPVDVCVKCGRPVTSADPTLRVVAMNLGKTQPAKGDGESSA